MAVMRVAQVSRPKGPFEIVERPIPEPGPGTVQIKVQACGVCHSDSLTKEGGFPGLQYPRVPGHEVAGVIDAVGPGVAGWEPGHKVGVGWNGGYCAYCDPCRRGAFPINFLLIEALREYHRYYGDTFRIECPTGSGRKVNLDGVAHELAERLG